MCTSMWNILVFRLISAIHFRKKMHLFLQQDAAKAVVKTDGLRIGDHEIEVAISNPPQRGTPLNVRDETSFTPSLGGGKKETET